MSRLVPLYFAIFVYYPSDRPVISVWWEVLRFQNWCPSYLSDESRTPSLPPLKQGFFLEKFPTWEQIEIGFVLNLVHFRHARRNSVSRQSKHNNIFSVGLYAKFIVYLIPTELVLNDAFVVLQRQGFRGWVLQTEPGRVRFVPVRGSGPAKKSGGTGVFLPRVSVKEEVNKRNSKLLFSGPTQVNVKKFIAHFLLSRPLIFYTVFACTCVFRVSFCYFRICM